MPCFQACQPVPPCSSPPASESSFVMCHISELTNLLLPLPPLQSASLCLRCAVFLRSPVLLPLLHTASVLRPVDKLICLCRAFAPCSQACRPAVGLVLLIRVEVPTFASTSARPSLNRKEQDRIETGDSTCPSKGSRDSPYILSLQRLY